MLISTNEVANRYGVTNRQVLYAIRMKKIKGKKVGWSWVCDTRYLPEKWPVRGYNND